MTIEEQPPEKLSVDNITRQVIEAAAKKIESMNGNPTYEQAWRLAVRAIRAMKPD